MRVLVTGGAGYIGSITVRALLERGTEVTVLDTLERGHAGAVDSRAAFVEGDIRDRAVLDVALDGVDAVLHCAGYIEVAESQERPARYFENNLAKPVVMLEEMHRRDITAIVFSSTAAVYGEPESTPIPETAALSPINAYGASKLAFERVLDWGEQEWGLSPVRLRYFNVAGAMEDGSLGEAHDPETHIVPRLLKACAGGQGSFEVYGDDYPTPDGTCVRDYLHVCDLADAHALALERAVEGGSGVFNLGNGDGYSNLQVVRACAEVVGVDIDVAIGPRRPGDPAVLVASAAEARRALGWAPSREDLTQIVGDAWHWHKTHPEGFSS